MFLLKTGDEPGKKTGTLQFTASNGNRTGQLFPIMAEILLCLLCQSQDFFRAAPQKHSIFCQNNMVSASLKQRNTQLLLQLYQLPGKSGLRQVEQISRFCDIFFPRYRQEVF